MWANSQLSNPQILGWQSTRHRSDDLASGRCLIDVDPRIFAICAVIFPAVHGAQSENLALNKPAWSTDNSTSHPPGNAVNGNPAIFARVLTANWPFLAVDLGVRVTWNRIVLSLNHSEFLVCYSIWGPWRQKQVSRVRINNDIAHNTYPCPRNILLVQKSSYVRWHVWLWLFVSLHHTQLKICVPEAGTKAGISNYIPHYMWDIITCPSPWCPLFYRCEIISLNLSQLQKPYAGFCIYIQINRNIPIVSYH